MPRENSSDLLTIVRPNKSAFTFPPAPSAHTSSHPRRTTIRLLPGSTFRAQPHFHLTHTEYLQIVSGTARVVLSDQEFTATKDSGPITVPRSVVHDWWKHPTEDAEEDLVVWEWTDPDDGGKEVFFRNLFGVLGSVAETDAWGYGSMRWVFMMLPTQARIHILIGVVEANGDNYALPWLGWSGWWAARWKAVALTALGWVFGLAGWYKEYTPDWLVEKLNK